MTLSLPQTERALCILAALGIPLNPESYTEQIRQFHRLCSTWNLAAKLMSRKDLESRFDDHVADSLSLAGEIATYPNHDYIDIGSGGGFPGIPVALSLPNREVALAERSQTKADFLQQAIRHLDLKRVAVIRGSYPMPIPLTSKKLYTARAIERPEEFDASLIPSLGTGDVYLLQRELPTDVPMATLKVTPVVDAFTDAGLRRGVLYRIER